MMEKLGLGRPSVDILCLFYNAEKWIDQLFDCLLSQTYDNINIIAADDGSNDKTLEMLELYRNKIKKRGFNYCVLHQKNGGPASAYNLCLSKSRGDYILQIDCDDVIKKDAIEKFVNVLNQNPNIGYVRSNGWMHYIGGEKEDVEFLKLGNIKLEVQKQEDLCIPILIGSAYLAPPCHFMYRRNCLKEIYKEMKIDESRLGQAYQIILPLSYKYKAAYISEPLFWYTFRSDSFEHTTISKEKELWKIEESARLIRVALNVVEAPKEFIEKYANLRELKLKLDFAYKYNDKKMSYNAYKSLKKIEKPSLIDRKNYYSTQFKILDMIRVFIRKIHLKKQKNK